MKKDFTYISNYKGVKIYQYDDDKKYTATVYTKSIKDKDLNNIRAKIDEFINKSMRRWFDDLDY
jgi:hypothetical protein